MTFRVGQKVVCVDVANRSWTIDWISLGCVYEIASIDRMPRSPGGVYDGVDGHVLELIGIDKPNGFLSIRFRPIVERKTEISVFTAMLTGSKIGASA